MLERSGSGINGNLTVLDVMAILSFLVGLENLDLNVTQNDFQNMMQTLDEKTEQLLTEIHSHLEQQDKKLNAILRALEVIE